jgi:hypothetical protein
MRLEVGSRLEIMFVHEAPFLCEQRGLSAAAREHALGEQMNHARWSFSF